MTGPMTGLSGPSRLAGLAGSGATPSPDPEATRLSAVAPPHDDLASTGPMDLDPDLRIRREPLESPDDLTPLHRPTDPHEEVPPPPPFEEVPERPLFASTARRVPSAAAALAQGDGLPVGALGGPSPSGVARPPAARTSGVDVPTQHVRTGPRRDAGGRAATGSSAAGDFWPFTDDEEPRRTHTGKEGRGWLRTAVAVAVMLVLVVAVAVAFNRGREVGALGLGGTSTDPTNATRVQAQTIEVVAAEDFDPYGSPAEENPQDVAQAIDDDAATSWRTLTYYGNPALGGLKPGVGLLLDLGRDRRVGSVSLQLGGAPTSLEVYAAPSGTTTSPTTLEGLDRVGARAAAPARTTVRLASRPTTRYVLVWLTSLPAADDGYRGEIAGVTVRE